MKYLLWLSSTLHRWTLCLFTLALHLDTNPHFSHQAHLQLVKDSTIEFAWWQSYVFWAAIQVEQLIEKSQLIKILSTYIIWCKESKPYLINSLQIQSPFASIKAGTVMHYSQHCPVSQLFPCLQLGSISQLSCFVYNNTDSIQILMFNADLKDGIIIWF